MHKYRLLFYLIVSIFAFGCKNIQSNYPPTGTKEYGPGQKIDSLIDIGANHYDVASYLFKHPEYLNVIIKPRMDSDIWRYSVNTSADGKLRVYSFLDDLGYPQDVHNIFQYLIDDDLPVRVQADECNDGTVKTIGMRCLGVKTYYLIVTEYVSYHNCYSTGITAYSVQSDWDNSLKKEPVFLTKGGNLIDSISIMWDDPHEDREDYFYGVELDNPVNTKEVHIQVVDAENGMATNKSIVYRWDGKHFAFSDIKNDT